MLNLIKLAVAREPGDSIKVTIDALIALEATELIDPFQLKNHRAGSAGAVHVKKKDLLPYLEAKPAKEGSSRGKPK